uniref:Claudin 8 n=1 Tax=Oryzias latipes TaxID=8090 RepID=A0A3P9KXI1_ORYLA
MANSTMEIVAIVATLVGLIGAAASTGMPMWRVTAFIGENIIVMETRWEGLWMNCFRQANIRMQCKVYDSLLALPPDLQAARGLMCCALALCGIGILISVVGMQCTSCIVNNDRAKRLVLIIAGSLILSSCICVLIPVSWTGNVIIRDFYNPLLLDAQRRELGEALYIGWVASAFLFAGGCIFICCNIQSDEKESQRYLYPRNTDYRSYTPQPLLPLQPQPSTIYSYDSRYPSHFVSNNGSIGQQFAVPLQNAPQVMASRGSLVNPSVIYTPAQPETFVLTSKSGSAYFNYFCYIMIK